MYLLDTNVVSELRRVRPHGAVLAWLQDVRDEDLHISAVTIGEIQSGIEIARERDQAKAAEIEAWLERIAETYNVLSMDARIFRTSQSARWWTARLRSCATTAPRATFWRQCTSSMTNPWVSGRKATSGSGSRMR